MSALPENELDLDKLFLPAWAQEPASAKHYAQYEGGEDRPDRRGDRRGRGPGRRDAGPSDRSRGQRGPQGDRKGPRQDSRGPNRGFDRNRPAPRRDERRDEPPAPLPEVNISMVPDEKGVESLARQIKTTGRAYPLFDIARLILQRPERYTVEFSLRKKSDGQIAQPLFACALDDTLWLSEEEAQAHVLKNHFNTFYQTERTATEPPKGKYTFVAQCGMSGIILGPPNYHDYQNQLRKLHSERFSRMPFEAFKSRVKIVRDEAVVKKWVDDQSWKTEYSCLNTPEPLRLPSMEAVEKHFREVHKDNIIKPVESHRMTGAAARSLRSTGLVRLVRQVGEDQKRFPLQIATVLSQQFASHGLQFFKVSKTITHVSVARPHFLDLETTPVSDGVRRIVEFINSNPKRNRRDLVEKLAPSPAPAPIPVAPPVGEEQSAVQTPSSPDPTPEQTAIIADLHWLIHQGHVIEFANGILETAKKPLPRPPKPEVKKSPKPSDATPSGETAPSDAAPSGEAAEEAIPVATEPDLKSDVISTTEEASAVVTKTADTTVPAESGAQEQIDTSVETPAPAQSPVESAAETQSEAPVESQSQSAESQNEAPAESPAESKP